MVKRVRYARRKGIRLRRIKARNRRVKNMVKESRWGWRKDMQKRTSTRVRRRKSKTAKRTSRRKKKAKRSRSEGGGEE